MRPNSKAHSLSKAVLSLFLILLTTVTSWGETKQLGDYTFDADGDIYLIKSATDLSNLAGYVSSGKGSTSGLTFKVNNSIETSRG